MATETRHSGTLRTDYETAPAMPDGLTVMESDRDRLLHRLVRGSEGTVRSLLEDHVLTVLADIRRKRIDGYGSSFAGAQGTAVQARYARKLRHDMEGWTARLEEYLRRALATGSIGSPAATAARKLHSRLEKALSEKTETVSDGYYKMLRAVTAIQEDTDRYRQQAEASGDTEPSIALLIAHMKNYAGIADTFNHRLASLPELYYNKILHIRTDDAREDGNDAPTTEEEEHDSSVTCGEVTAVYVEGGKAYRQTLISEGQATGGPLFTHGTELRTGWQVESPMLVLNGGERKVDIGLRLTADSPVPDIPETRHGLVLQISTAEGWEERPCTCTYDVGQLCIGFTLGGKDITPSPCTEETHGTATAYPAIRLLTDSGGTPYGWAAGLRFDAVEIRTEASGICDFTLYNELGEADTGQPVSPFGITAECGAWLLFGNEETGLKPLQEVRLKGTWQKLPETEDGFNSLYRDYGVTLKDFTLRTEYQQDGRWHECTDGTQHLFIPDNGEERSPGKADIVFRFPKNVRDGYEYARDKDGFFRVTLSAPAIGFGMEAYRRLFTERMTHNGRCKEKDRLPLPQEPPIPLLADMELSYTASERVELGNAASSPGFRLSRITELDGQKTVQVEGSVQTLLPDLHARHYIYFRLDNAAKEKTVRIYADTELPKERIPFGIPEPEQKASLGWERLDGTAWTALPPDAVIREKTCGLTRNGFIEIDLQTPSGKRTDKDGRVWLRASVTGDINACLALRGLDTNHIRRSTVESSVNPPPISLHHRHRAVRLRDYEELTLAHFPYVDKACCVAIPRESGQSDICVIVFSRAEDDRYFLSPPWKLEEIGRTISRYAPPMVEVKAVNPHYERTVVKCRAVSRDGVGDESLVLRQLTQLARDCVAPWIGKGMMPDPCHSFSYKELHARMANHEALQRLVSLEVDGFSLPGVGIETEDRYFKGSKGWSILLPETKIELLAPGDGIENAEIGGNFIIG